MTHAPIPVEAQIEAGIDPGGIRLALDEWTCGVVPSNARTG